MLVDLKLEQKIILSIELTPYEAGCLKGMMQNPQRDTESVTEQNIRESLFNAVAQYEVKP